MATLIDADAELRTARRRAARSGTPGGRAVRVASWSNVLPAQTTLIEADERLADQVAGWDGPFIGRGSGRSLGDAAYLGNGITVSSLGLRRIAAFDRQRGTLTCGAGVQMAEVFQLLEGSGWSMPVGGGTRWVTLGGAVASDIHGKNDRRVGSFGNHVESLELVLADGSRVSSSRAQHPELFAATIGGMGLTGFIMQVTLRLSPASSTAVRIGTEPFHTIEDMVQRFEEDRSDFQVGWMDLTGRALRGIYYRASAVAAEAQEIRRPIEWDFPTVKLFNRPLVRGLNAARFWRQRRVDEVTHVANFHFQVDALKHWNRFYGPRGFQEYQFAAPAPVFTRMLASFFAGIRRHRLSPFFAVAKRFGPQARAGLLSFPQPGYTFMADFESRPDNRAFFTPFTELVLEAGGRIYLAKDSYLTADQFERMYPYLNEWRQIVRRYDSKGRIQSDLSLRLRMKPW